MKEEVAIKIFLKYLKNFDTYSIKRKEELSKALAILYKKDEHKKPLELFSQICQNASSYNALKKIKEEAQTREQILQKWIQENFDSSKIQYVILQQDKGKYAQYYIVQTSSVQIKIEDFEYISSRFYLFCFIKYHYDTSRKNYVIENVGKSIEIGFDAQHNILNLEVLNKKSKQYKKILNIYQDQLKKLSSILD